MKNKIWLFFIFLLFGFGLFVSSIIKARTTTPEINNSLVLKTKEEAEVRKKQELLIQKIEKITGEAFEKGRFNGQVLYAENNQILFNKSFGYENLKTKTPLSESSVYQLSSTSKPFTAIAILQLAEQQKLNIDNLVIFYLPDFPYKNVTVRNLLEHRSGLPDYIWVADRYWDKRKILTNQDISSLLRKYSPKLTFTPDSRFKYCNTNYAYLALIVEKLSKESFANYVKANIFEKAGMKESFVYCAKNKNNTHAVKGYSYSRKRGFYERPNDYLDGVVGDKGIYSTASDLFLFDNALYDETLLSKESIQKAFTPARELNEKNTRDYGLGFRVKRLDSTKNVVYHNGWWKGFRSYYIHDYENNRTLIWLNNRSDVTITPYLEAILNEQVGEENEQIQGDFGSAE